MNQNKKSHEEQHKEAVEIDNLLNTIFNEVEEGIKNKFSDDPLMTVHKGVRAYYKQKIVLATDEIRKITQMYEDSQCKITDLEDEVEDLKAEIKELKKKPSVEKKNKK